jgi:hypothetical protein
MFSPAAIQTRLVPARLIGAVLAAALAAVALLGMTPKPARAAGPITVVRVIKLPAVVIDNQCTRDPVHPVGLGFGELTIITTIVPIDRGGQFVQGTVTFSRKLAGEDLITHEKYQGAEGELSFMHYLPGGGGSFYDAMWSALVPQSAGTRMFFVEVVRGTLNPDFTLSTIPVARYLACAPPSR